MTVSKPQNCNNLACSGIEYSDGQNAMLESLDSEGRIKLLFAGNQRKKYNFFFTFTHKFNLGGLPFWGKLISAVYGKDPLGFIDVSKMAQIRN